MGKGCGHFLLIRAGHSRRVFEDFQYWPFVEVEYEQIISNCDHVDISNRTDARSKLMNVSYILDVYLPIDKDHRVVSRGPKDNKAVFCPRRTRTGCAYTL